MTDLGREIPITDGRKPEWLADDERIIVGWKSGVWSKPGAWSPVAVSNAKRWPCVDAIRLRADHPFYKQEAPAFPTKEQSACLHTALLASTETVAMPYDTDKYVLVERVTNEAWDELWNGSGISAWAQHVGIIKPDPTPLERYMEQYPGDDRDTVLRVLEWKGL